MSLQINRFKENTILLQKHADSNFKDLSIDRVYEMSQFKLQYKSEKGTPDYEAYRKLLKDVRLKKLPFRLIDLVNTHLKLQKKLPLSLSQHDPSSNNNNASSNKIGKPERKLHIQKLEKDLIESFSQIDPQYLSLAENIYWVHGSNSSLLALLPYTQNKLICTGELLKEGLAPMCGELRRGVAFNGVNQNYLSVETIRNVPLSWKYATTISASFDVKEFNKADDLFENAIQDLLKITPEDGNWNKHIIDLTCLKQYNPDAFERNKEKYSQEIINIKENLSTANTLKYAFISKALNYDVGKFKEEVKLKQGVIDPLHGPPVVEEFSSKAIPEMEMYWYNLERENNYATIDNISTFNLYFARDFRSNFKHIIEQILRLKMWGKQEFRHLTRIPQDTYTKRVWEAIAKEIDPHLSSEITSKIRQYADRPALSPNLLQKLKHLVSSAPFPVSDDEISTILACLLKSVGQRAKIHEESDLNPHKAAGQRLGLVFDRPPWVKLTDQDLSFVTQPFPILLASTNTPAFEMSFKETEYNLKHATLGKEIDVVFVRKENKAVMRTWLQEHKLEDKIKIYDAEKFVSHISKHALHHAPHQVTIAQSFINALEMNSIEQLLNLHAFPLYKKPYPEGFKRIEHGVPHAAETAFFALIIGGIYMEAGKSITTSKENLILAAALHDCARKNDGEDFWDADSGQQCKDILLSQGNVKEEEALILQKAIAEKDNLAPETLEQKIIHDADCIGIIRCLNNLESFRIDKLWMMRELNKEQTKAFVLEARVFIQLTNTLEIKSFIEEASSPLATLFQILYYSHIYQGRFSFLAPKSKVGFEVFQYSSSIQLTSEIKNCIDVFLDKNK